ncbi:M15 family metallopeptidase [Agromyces archimandritae]|uniref:M15 family metallopeptidase n=1 Tax=Agromyces archimandritae TaxID=2781962 RepID=A0A975FPN8_9MICO|nr:M15 family metallopeptidase [Agromyces archimandritae]
MLVAGILVVALIVALVVGLLSGGAGPSGEPTASTPGSTRPTPRAAPPTSEPPASIDTFDKTARSIDDPASIWVVVNRLRALNPIDYMPDDLVEVPVEHTWEPLMRQEAADAVVAMFEAASAEPGFALASNSAFRDYETQVELYGDGSDPTTAPPGHSEHQTGLTIDIGTVGGCSFECLETSPEGAWLRDNGYRFGFILRYPADKVDVTGYPPEPWHFRYIGVDLATEMHEQGITTLEEFFGLPAAG